VTADPGTGNATGSATPNSTDSTQPVRIESTGEARLTAVISRRRQARRAAPSVNGSKATTAQASQQTPPNPNGSAAPADSSADGDPSSPGATRQSASPLNPAAILSGDATGSAQGDGADDAGGDPAAQPHQTGTDADPDANPDADGDKPKAIRKMEKRIDTLTARLKTLEKENAQLKGGSANPNPDAGTPAIGEDGDLAASHPEVAQLDSQINQYRTMLAWADEHEAGGGTWEYKDEKGITQAREFSATEVRQIRRNLELALTKAGTQRELKAGELNRQLEQQKAKLGEHFTQRFAWAKDPETQEAQLFEHHKADVLKAVPALKRLPAFDMFLAYAIEGIVAEGKRGQPAAKPATARPTPPRVAVPNPGGQVQRNDAEAALAKAEADWKRAPGEETYQRVLSLRRAARRKA